MMNKSWRKGVVALAVSAALGLGTAAVYADNTSGSIFGQAKQGTTISIVNLDTGLKRDLTVDESGRYTFSQLPTGRYKITAGTVTRDLVVNVGTGTPANFTDDQAEVLVVTGGRINPIDTSSVESSTVFTAAQIERLPVGRDVTSVALLAPGTVRGDTAFGNLASFGGSSVAENGYYINGFDVTNIRNFVSYATLPFEAIGEQQIKTGGYGAEYGRSLGGVINVVTKRGTNEWSGGVSAYWRPDGLRERSANVITRNPEELENHEQYFVYREDNKDDSFLYNVYGGGAIIEDRLFVFALLEGVDDSWERFGRTTSNSNTSDKPNGMVKVDWNITDDHILEFTHIINEQETKTKSYNNRANEYYTGAHGDLYETYTTRNGGDVSIARYTGHITDDFTLSAQYGELNNEDNYVPGGHIGSDCPRVWDSRTGTSVLVYRGCWNQNAPRPRDNNFGPDEDTREALRIDAEWLLGDHTLRFGYDDETFTSSHAGARESGSIYYRLYRTTGVPRVVNGVTVAPNTDYVRTWEFDSASGEYEVKNTAIYVEDSWRATDNVMVYVGIRNETFENLNGEGKTFVEANDLVAPRLGVSWDINGDSSMKAFANAGRYYIPVAANSNIRASAAERLVQKFFYYDGQLDPRTSAPVQALTQQIGATSVNGSLDAPDPGTVSVTNLEPMYQDEFLAGFQMTLSDNWTAGVRAIKRDVKNGMDDYCSHQPFVDWAEDKGYDNFDPDSMASCFFVNPGKDLRIKLDVNGDGNYTEQLVPNSYLGLPKYKRGYRAIELFWERTPSDGWYMQGSYTWSKSEGNIEGYVNSSLEQDDAGLTQDFDHKLFEDGADGYLPNDRRHSLKLFGSYQVNDEWRVSGNFVAQSGRPVSCQGFVPLDGLGVDVGSLNAYGASSFYCTNDQGQTVLTQRGQYGRTPWMFNFDMGLAYVPDWAKGNLTLKMDVYNIFNLQKVTEYSEAGEYDRATPTKDPNFLNVVNYQAPRSVTLSARYTF